MSTIHKAILEQVERRPEAVALRQGNVVVSYGELAARSERIAAGLRARGCARGSVVGVRMTRTPDLVVALLGVLRSGAAYLPLDPQDPGLRAVAALEDAGAILILGTSEGVELPPEMATYTPDELSSEAVGALPEVTGQDLAYVIFTSGSTGRPKGVAVPHHCVVAMLNAMAAEVADATAEVWLSVTSASFDVSVFEFFAPLARGAAVEIADISGPRLFSTPLAREGHDITHMQATPTLLYGLLLDPNSRRGLADLEHLTSGGEALTADLAQELRSILNGRLLNGYGPTEATVWASSYRVETTVAEPMSIGTPLAGQAMYVLTADATLVEEGAVGELFIGGAGVAWGYLGQPGLTAERFLPDPFSDVPGSRMYGTGDLARQLPDRNFVCLGREDRQVKIKGHRIELDEVENVLTQLDEVSAGAVIVVGQGVERRIVAVVAGPADTDTVAVRGRLEAVLTRAAVPSEVRLVDALPRTTSGKLDRRAMGDEANGPARDHDPSPYPRVVVVNELSQHALWWADRPVPPGWVPTGFVGSVAACSTEVDQLWPDIGPVRPA